MVYGFFVIGSLLVGTAYWIITTSRDEDVHDLMWSPGSGLIEPEPWLQSVNGGYSGWSPGSSAYAAWSPGAYLNLSTPTTTTRVPTTRTTERTRRSRRTRLPPLPADLPDIMPPSPSDGIHDDDIQSPSIADTSSDTAVGIIPPSDPEPEFDENRRPPGQAAPKPATLPPPTTLAPLGDDYSDYPRFWKPKDEDEEAYEENPQDLVNTRPPDKLPVEGWGYDYDNKA